MNLIEVESLILFSIKQALWNTYAISGRYEQVPNNFVDAKSISNVKASTMLKATHTVPLCSIHFVQVTNGQSVEAGYHSVCL